VAFSPIAVVVNARSAMISWGESSCLPKRGFREAFEFFLTMPLVE